MIMTRGARLICRIVIIAGLAVTTLILGGCAVGGRDGGGLTQPFDNDQWLSIVACVLSIIAIVLSLFVQISISRFEAALEYLLRRVKGTYQDQEFIRFVGRIREAYLYQYRDFVSAKEFDELSRSVEALKRQSGHGGRTDKPGITTDRTSISQEPKSRSMVTSSEGRSSEAASERVDILRDPRPESGQGARTMEESQILVSGSSSLVNRGVERDQEGLGITYAQGTGLDIQAPKVEVQPQRPTILYARVPESDGTFKISEVQETADFYSLYSLTILGKQELATLDLTANPDRIKAAIQSPQQYLAPVCDYKENPPPSATRIVVNRTGRVILKEQRWRIQERLRIEFL
jgi:hypothetical protein